MSSAQETWAKDWGAILRAAEAFFRHHGHHEDESCCDACEPLKAALWGAQAGSQRAAGPVDDERSALRARVGVLEKALRDVLEKLEWCVGAGSDIPAITRARAALKAEGEKP